jgi:hypothetical protein
MAESAKALLSQQVINNLQLGSTLLIMWNLISSVINNILIQRYFCFLSSKDYMPFSDIYVSTLKKDIEYSQLLVQSVMALQTNKFIQVTTTDTHT